MRKAFLFLILVLLPVAFATGCAPPTPSTVTPVETSPPATEVLVANDGIAGLGLEGRLILLRFEGGTPSVFALDLATGEYGEFFRPPRGAWVTSTSASPVAGKLAMAYAPAPAEGQAQRGYTGISLIALDGSGPLEEFIPPAEGESIYSFPAWAPDGSSLYYNRFFTGDQSAGGEIPVINRQGYPEGEAEVLVTSARWPNVSADGQSIVYVEGSLSPGSPESLMVLNLAASGAQPAPVPLGPAVEIVDAPMFSPDGRMVYFSAPAPVDPEGGAGQSFLEQWLAVPAAEAHSVPSEWWRVPVEGGQAEQLTDIGQPGLYGVFSPDGTKIAFISGTGVYVMNPDGGSIETLIEADGFFGSIDWVP